MSFAALLCQTCTIEARTGQGAYGPVYAAPVESACRCQDEAVYVRNAQGEEVLSNSLLFLPTSVTITAGSRVTFPGGHSTEAITVGQSLGAAAVHHLKVRLK